MESRGRARRYAGALIVAGWAALSGTACFEKTLTDCPPSAPYRVGDTGCSPMAPTSPPVDGGTSQPDMKVAECMKSTDCLVEARPICDSTTLDCRACNPTSTPSECAARDSQRPLCAPKGNCVECLTSADCLEKNLACDPGNGTCVACKKNADCASGLCSADKCADPDGLIYVDKEGPDCVGGGAGQGTFKHPYCTLQAGLDRSAKDDGKVVIVFGRSSAYGETINIKPTSDPYKVKAIGVGQPTLSPTTAGPAITVSTTTQSVDLVLDGFVVKGAQDSGISCSSTAPDAGTTHLTLLRTTLRDNKRYGLAAQDCRIDLDQTTIANNQVGGLSLTDTDALISNTLVWQNGVATSGDTYGGINIATPTKGTTVLVNSSIVANKSNGASLASGLSCVSSTSVLNTVVFGNSGAASEINAEKCKPDHSAFVGAMTPMSGTDNVELTGCVANTVFKDVDMGNFTPVSGGTCSLVDRGAAMANLGGMPLMAPDHDLIGISRPQPVMGSFDIGAYELTP